MKKSLLIILLCATQYGCSTQTGTLDTQNTLLSYNDLANEITIDYENVAGRSIDRSNGDEPLDTP